MRLPPFGWAEVFGRWQVGPVVTVLAVAAAVLYLEGAWRVARRGSEHRGPGRGRQPRLGSGWAAGEHAEEEGSDAGGAADAGFADVCKAAARTADRMSCAGA